MRGLFRHRTETIFNKKVLLLINSTPRLSYRSYSTALQTANDDFVSQEILREKALKRYGLSNLHLVWPTKVEPSEQVDYKSKNPRSIRQMYGDADLSKLPIFSGGFINFGYWPNPLINIGEITKNERDACSQEMYKVIGDLARILKSHSVLEIGSGLGYGSSLISQRYSPQLVVGMDISPDQIERAKRFQVSGIEAGKLRFTIGEAESMPFTDKSFDIILSVEAAQHFSSMEKFSKEACRILKPGGSLVVTSFFPKSHEGVKALNEIVPDAHVHASENTIDEVGEALGQYMEDVEVHSIGENVWHGFSAWLDQIGYHHQWSKIWPALYEKGLIDYVVYQAKSPMEECRHQLK